METKLQTVSFHEALKHQIQQSTSKISRASQGKIENRWCQSNEARGNLADLMAHSVSTATRFYQLQETSKSSIKCSKHLCQVMHGEEERPSIST